MKKKEFVIQDILSKIYQNQFETGKLPNQRDLAQEYGVSRFTIQEAIQTLKEIGVLQVVQGSGMFINQSIINNPMVYNSMTMTPYERISSKLIQLTREAATPADNQVFQFTDKAEVWSFERLRVVNYRIQQIERSRLPVALFPDFNEEVVKSSIQRYILEQGYQISHNITTYAPMIVDRQEAQLLQVKKGTPAMKIMNRGLLTDGRIYEYSELVAIDYACSYITPFNAQLHAARIKG